MKQTITILLLIAVGLLGYIAFNQNKGNEPFSFGEAAIDVYTASTTSFTTTAGKATIILPKNPSRAGAVIRNETATVAYLSYHATTTPNTIPILEDKEFVIPIAASGGTFTIDDDNRWIGQVIASSSAAVTLDVMELY